MRESFENALYSFDFIKDVPIECNDGWFHILYRMCIFINNELVNSNNVLEFKIAQVKEKFGTLRVYCDYSNEIIDKIIDEAERQSKVTCEICGRQGKLFEDGGWLYVRCDECRTSS